MAKDTMRSNKLQRIGDRITAEKRESLQQIGEQLALLEENPNTPAQVTEGIRDHLCELGSVVNLWNPRVLRACYWILAEEAEKLGVDLTEGNYVGQEIRANPQDYPSDSEEGRPN